MLNMRKFVILLMFTCTIGSVCCRNNLKLIHNGYEGLLVGISDSVPENYCNKVIHGLKVILTEFSAQLWHATEGRASLRDVTISLPRSWRTNSLTCSLLHSLQPAVPPIKPHISITETHPLFGNKPWTQQSQGCGRSGDFIQMGAEALRSGSNESRTNLAKQLVNEWIKFRWGVFDQNGQDNDPLYPSYFRDPNENNLRPNRCSGGKDNVLQFCDSQNHIPEAPTKHNSFCMGRPAWEVIMQSHDFANGRNKPSNSSITEPTFHFIKEGAPRFVLAVEDTAVMNMQRRWEFVRKAVRRTVVYDVPDGAYMGLVVFNSVANTVAPLSKIDSSSDVRQRIGSSLPRNPSTVPESQKCLLCGIQESLRALEQEPVGASGANVILLTSGTSAASEQEMEEIVRLVKTRGIRVTPIIYPLTEKPGSSPFAGAQSLDILMNSEFGDNKRLFTVVDEGVGNDSKVSMMVSLMDILLAAVRLSCPPENPGTPVIVHSQAYPGGISSMSSGRFTIDKSLGSSMRFSVYYYDLNHVGNTIQLTSPSGLVMSSGNLQEEDGDANVIFINIPKAERGEWKYNVENRADSHQGLNIQVTAFENQRRRVSINVWTNSEGVPLAIPDSSNSSKPLIIYAKVKDSGSPVLGAQVMARLQRLGTNETGYPYSPIFINLLDNGAGDPDVTKDDGVYSRYLPQIFKFTGHYELSVIADHNNGLAKAPTLTRRGRFFENEPKEICCGSVLKYKNMKPVDSFHREITYGILNVIESAPKHDNIPPSRILDLKTKVNDSTQKVTLKWTAPGDNYDWGRANSYEAVIAPSWKQAKAMEGEGIIDLPIPQNAAVEQVITIDTDRFDEILYIAMRALDISGNKGAVSNIASIYVPHPPTTRPPPTTPFEDLSSSYSSEPFGHGLTQDTYAGIRIDYLLGALAGCFIFIVFILLSACICHHRNSKKNRQHRKCNDNIIGNNSIMIKSGSSVMIEDESRDSADSVVKDCETMKDGRSLSPVQSWAPSKLLAEHERRFSVSSGPVGDQMHTMVPYTTNINDPFPDVTLTGTHSYPSSQTPSTTHSDPPAYQPHYVTDGPYQYPYPYQHSYAQEELPPYTPAISSQSSQASSGYINDPVQNADIPFHMEVPASFSSDMPQYLDGSSYTISQPTVFLNPSDTAIRPHLPGRKVPPPVAPKPQARPNYSPSSSSGSSEPKRRNVTQV